MEEYCNSASNSDLCILDTSLTTITFNIRGGGHIFVVQKLCIYYTTLLSLLGNAVTCLWKTDDIFKLILFVLNSLFTHNFKI